MELYKVLSGGRVSPFKGFKYKIGVWNMCEDFDENPKNECSNGFYATEIDGIPYSWNIKKHIYLVEVDGKKVEIDQYKRRYEKIRIIRKCTKKEIVKKAKAVESKIGYKLSEVIYPIHPLKGTPKKVQQKHVNLLDNLDSVIDSMRDSVWSSVRDSVIDSVWSSVWSSVRDSVWDSVWSSVRDSVWDSVRDPVWSSVMDSVRSSVVDSVGIYVSSLFPNIEKWKYIDHNPGENPFQPWVDLWRSGFVPSFDGKVWRLHSGKNAKIVYTKESE